MNSLSWFLYLADVFPKLMVAPLILSGVLTLAAIIVGCIYYCDGKDDQRYSHLSEKGLVKITFGTKLIKGGIWGIALFGVFLFINNLIPNKETFYLIAGSELGEQVIATPEAREVFNDIKTIIKQQIKGATENGN